MHHSCHSKSHLNSMDYKEIFGTTALAMCHSDACASRLQPMYSLRNHLILQVFLPLALLTSILVWTSFTVVEGMIEARLQKEIEMVARSLRAPVESALNNADLARVSEALGVVSEISQVYGAYVYNSSGQRIDMAGEIVPGFREQFQAAELAAIGEEQGLYEDMAGAPVYSYFVPLTGPIGQINGLLQVVREESDIKLRLGEARHIGTLVLITAIAIMLGILLVGHRLAVTRPIEKLLDDMSRIEKGDREWRATVQGPKEVVRLANGLNSMLNTRQAAEVEVARRRRAELDMSERLRVQEKDAALGRFSAGLVHELGAPLTVIDGDARRLEESAGQNGDSKRRLNRIRTQIDRTRRLIMQLMTFVREERREPEDVSIRALVERTVSGARPEADSRGIGIEVLNAPADSHVRGYEVRLEHALLNLVRNALQAADRRIRVTASNEAGRTVISVEDDGPGIAPPDRERIFEPFLSKREDGSGTGLGLAIVSSVVKEHGGNIRVDSSDTLGGSRFVLEILGRES